VNKGDGRNYREIPLAWRAVNLPQNLDEVIFRLVYDLFYLFFLI
jgi:hypothetical protein